MAASKVVREGSIKKQTSEPAVDFSGCEGLAKEGVGLLFLVCKDSFKIIYFKVGSLLGKILVKLICKVNRHFCLPFLKVYVLKGSSTTKLIIFYCKVF